jgi:hypothetical protein
LCPTGTSTASERDFSVSGYTVLDRRNELLPREVKMMMVERLNKLNRQKY